MRPGQLYLIAGGQHVALELRAAGEEVVVLVGERALRVRVREVEPGVLEAVVEDLRRMAFYAREEDTIHLHWDGHAYTVSRARHAAGPRGPEPEQDVRTPLPGLLTRVLVQPGQEVAAGQPLYVVEAMKIETVVRAPRPARVRRVLAQPGQQVEGGAVVVELEGGP